MAVSVSKHLIARPNDPYMPHFLCYLLWGNASTDYDPSNSYLMNALKSVNLGIRHGYTAHYVYMLKGDCWSPLKNRSADDKETAYVFEKIFGEDSIERIDTGLKVFIDPKQLALVKLKAQFIDNRYLIK